MSLLRRSVKKALGRDHCWDITHFGADPTGSANARPAVDAAHVAAAADSPKGKVVAPIGIYRLDETATMLASMDGVGGSGYTANFARAVFVPTMTDGSPALKGVNLQGSHFSRFAVDTGLSTAAARNCIGIQLGQCAALIASATNANPCVISTKHPHTFQTGNSVNIANVLGMTALNGNTYTATRVDALSFSIGVDSTAFGSYSGGGLIYPTDLGTANNVGRGALEDVVVSGMRTGFHLQGWLNKQLGLKAFNCTLGLDGSYLNSNIMDLVAENCGQAVQLLGCVRLHLLRVEDEGGLAGSLAQPSTIDYSNSVTASMWSTEGVRTTDTPWLDVANVSYCQDIHIRDGAFASTPGSAKSVRLGNVSRYSLPRQLGSGFSTTASTEPHTPYTPAWTSSGTAPALGSGTLTGHYHWNGSEVTVQIRLVPGGTTTFGTGNYSFSLPFPAKRNAVGAAKLLDLGTAHHVGSALIAPGASTVDVFAPAHVGQLSPFTWASGDSLDITITYAI